MDSVKKVIDLKEIEFTEEQLSNLSEIGQQLFEDENDPRSVSYVRKLQRPKINWFVISLWLLVPVIVLIMIGCLMNYYEVRTLYIVMILAGLFLIYSLVMAKRAVICQIKIYQRYASDALRNKCRFEPSCSEYMILSIEKHGLIKGIKQGIRRLKRCKVGDGGYDYP